MYHSQAEPQVASRVPLSLTGDDDAITATEQSLSAQIRDFSPQELGLQFPKPISEPSHVFQPISIPEGHPKLTYKPHMLRPRYLLVILIFHAAIFSLLMALVFVQRFSSKSKIGYWAIQILPAALGTVTTAIWHAIKTSLSRISPYISTTSESDSANRKMNSARRTILACYFPSLAMVDILRNRDGLLAVSWISSALSDSLLPFKAVLLNTAGQDDYWEATALVWALYTLTLLYAILMLGLLALIYCLWNIVTGLRWDPEAIADHLVLFRHSNFIAEFIGMETASRKRMYEHFKGDRFRLGYWDLGSQRFWHGFGRIEHDLPESIPGHDINLQSIPIADAQNSARLKPEDSPQPGFEAGVDPNVTHATLTMQQVSEASYRSAYLNMSHSAMLLWTTLALILFGLLLGGAIIGLTSRIKISLPYGVTTFLFQFLPTFLVSLYTWFWQDVDNFCRATQPFVHMHKPNPAHKNLLLKYTCHFTGQITYTAFMNKDWKVARVSAVSLLQRLLPILVAGMITVVDEHDYCAVHASLPLLIISLIFLGAYVILIPYEVTEDGLKRHLPRNYEAIADQISWCYASSLLQSDAFDVQGPKYEQWQMEAILRLKLHSYQYGVYKSTIHDGTHCIGFDEEDKAEPVGLPDKRSLRRRRHRASHGEDDQKRWEMSRLTGVDTFKERPSDPTTIQSAAPHAEEDAPPDESEIEDRVSNPSPTFV